MALAAVLLTSLYAATDEFHQRFTPGRMSDVQDWLADTLGSVVAVTLVAAVKRGAGRRAAGSTVNRV